MKKMSVESKLVEKFKIETNIRKHKIIIDQPADSGGTDAGPTPLEYFLTCFAGCVITTGKIIAHQKKIEIKNFTVIVDGEYDPRVILGKTKEVRAGFHKLNIKINLDANITDEEKKEFIKEIEYRCPVSDNIKNDTPISFEVV